MAVRRATLFVSLSKNIFENLAFEEWLLRNRSIDQQGESMLLWSNHPAVVIGRHQNPWLEAHMKFLANNNIELARRHSGGGTVYHDLGNINISILTTPQNHNRKRNLQLLANFLSHHYNINVEPSGRDDLLLQPGNRKISGTAARIIRRAAYHHLTLLVEPEIDKLKSALCSSLDETTVRTNATRSVHAAAVGYLAEDVPGIAVDDVMDSLRDFYKQQHMDTETVLLPDVTDDMKFPGVHKMEQELRSWPWIYGRTPKFEFQLFDERVCVEGGLVIECGNDSTSSGSGRSMSGFQKRLIGSSLPVDLNQAYLGIKLPSTFGGIDFTSYLAKFKHYLKDTPKGINPKLVALQATVISAALFAITFLLHDILFTTD